MYDVSSSGLFSDFSHPTYADSIGSLPTDHMDSWDGASYGVPYAYTTGGPWAYNYFDLSGNKCGLFEWFIDNEGSAEYFSPNNLGSQR